MTEIEITRLIATCDAKGREVQRWEAAAFIHAQSLLERDSKDEIARQVVDDFLKYVSTGCKPDSFAIFMIHPPPTDEEIFEREKYREPHKNVL